MRIGNRLIGKEVINIQMKGREFYSIESLNNNDASRFHLEEVILIVSINFRMTGLQEELYIGLCILGVKEEEWSISFR